VWGPLVRRVDVPTRRERVTTHDGDFVDLDWVDGREDAPLLLVLHGLEGSCRSHYAMGLLRQARELGWRGVGLNFRSCSGSPNLSAGFYHSGQTEDLDLVVRLIANRRPDASLVAVGVSLGANVLLKWLGEQGDKAPGIVRGAVGISVPFDLEACARVLDRGFAKWTYTASFMRSFKRKVALKASLVPDFKVDLATALRARTFAQYDRAVTAPLHGFADELDYWRRSSCKPFLGRIRRPVLLLNAVDDPFVPPDALPEAASLPPNVLAEFTPRGGHVGFVTGPPWRPRAWAEVRAIDFLRGVL
jgi:predicted alpha/beta-fold hydrolase